MKVNTKNAFGTNVNAANLHEDQSLSGAQAYGQSETSVAGAGPYVVEAWNDATGFFSPCPSPMNKEEGTGYGFSADGGRSFIDQGGLPNANCRQDVLSGDPSVEAWQSGNSAYFYISSLYDPVFSRTGPPSDARSFIAINACKASGTGATALIGCSQPIIVAASTQCHTFKNPSGDVTNCSFLDKEYLSIDPLRGRLYISYTEFGINFSPPDNLTNGQIELAACDIGKPNGTHGPQGGTASNPVCFPGESAAPNTPGTPYFIIARGDLSCEQEGAYPAVDMHTGAVYVAFEFNQGTNIFGSGGPVDCRALPTKQVVNYIPATCLTLSTNSPCGGGPVTIASVNIVSMDSAFIPGYSRFPMNDFPRIAVSDKVGTVSIVWNDARSHPYGDILLQSFQLGSLASVQNSPVRVNSSTNGWHMLPALRNADANGNLEISFYGRASANSATTNVYAALAVNPRTISASTRNITVTTGPSDWNAVSSDIAPNFGDYTDNYLIANASTPFVGKTLYIAWSDGRLGDPQPFEDHVAV
ncbi:MAG: hypothetical protein NVSMB49_25530 [Ktedonobacteraceae bacterium]